MIDDTQTSERSADATASPGGASENRIGYCQECGRGLTAGMVRRVGQGVFCLSCGTQRATTAGWQSVNGAPYPGGYAAPNAAVPGSDEPRAGLAGLLGLIPGVGAMYNGQYAKGAMHLIVFVLLLTIADNLNWVFYWLVWGWVFYQAFDAYHTARAQKAGIPPPNPFGWNDLGERLGFHRPPPQAAPAPAAPPAGYAAPRPSPPWTGYVPPNGPASYVAPPTPAPVAYAAPFAGLDVAGMDENPYTSPYAAAPSGPGPGPGPISPLPHMSGPYVPTYTGEASGSPALRVGAGSGCGARRFPLGALWLIGLGLVFLVGNLLPNAQLSGRWLVPLLLAAAAAWSGMRRWEQFQSAAAVPGAAPRLAGAMVGPVLLLTVASLLGLQAARVISLRHSWPVLLVVWGSLLLVQRTLPPEPGALSPEVPMPPSSPMPPAGVRSTSGTGSLGL